MLCLSGFELYSRWLPLLSVSSHDINMPLLELIVTQIFVKLELKDSYAPSYIPCSFPFPKLRTNPDLQ